MTILLVSGATATLRGLPMEAPVGHLIVPHAGNDIAAIANSGRPWAADNGCGPKRDGSPGIFDEPAFLAMLDQIQDASAGAHGVHGDAHRRPLWVAVPDVVGDWRATRARFDRWAAELLRRYLSPAYVVQDGQPYGDLPPLIRCLFLGGSTDYKESDAALTLLRRWKASHPWGGPARVHVGRVNSERRLRLFDGLGRDVDGYPLAADSVDGTQFSMYPDRYIPRWSERLKPAVRARRAVPAPMFEEHDA
jgi:hypothetical protein